MSKLPATVVDAVGMELAKLLLDNVGNKVTEALLNGIVMVFKSNIASLDVGARPPESDPVPSRSTSFPPGNLLPPTLTQVSANPE